MSAEHLTAAEVAALTGLPEGAVAGWALARHIRTTTTPHGRVLYPAALTRHMHARDTRVARNIAAAVRLNRFIRNALLV